MANIPPLLSSSPPPLDITDDNEDFIDEIPDDEYTYDAVSDQNFNPNVMNEDKLHHNNESCQIADNDFNAIYNIGINKKCAETVNAEIEIIEHNVEVKSNGCENNNDKIDSPVVKASNIESAAQHELDMLETKEDTVNYLCHAPVKEVTELIDTPPPLDKFEEDEITYSTYGNQENTCMKDDIETELIKDNIDKCQDHIFDVQSNIGELSVPKSNDLPDAKPDHEFDNESSDASDDLKINLDERVINNDDEHDCSDDIDDFDDFICAPEPVTKIACTDVNQIECNIVERIDINVDNSPIGSGQSDSSINNANEEDNDFADFVFQEYASPESRNNIESDVKINLVAQNEDPKDQIQTAESVVTCKSSLPTLNSISAEERTIDNSQKNTDTDFDEDFGDFSSFETHHPPEVQSERTPNVLNLFNETMSLNKNNDEDTLITKLQSVVIMMFPDVQSNEDISEESIQKEVMCVLKDLYDLEITHATTFQWRNSKSHNATLKALGIDSRNIMYGPRWNNGMPRFASNLSCGPLEPLKPIPVNNNIANPTPQKIVDTCPKGTDANDLPAAKFDWAGAGLVNPLDGPVKMHSDMKENPQTTPTIEKQIEQPDKQIDFQSTDFSTPCKNCCKVKEKNNLNDTCTINKVATHSFNLPETHIYTSPTAVPQTENVVPQEKTIYPESNITDRYNLPDNIFNTDISTESFINISNIKETFDEDQIYKNKKSEDVIQLNVVKASLIENININGSNVSVDNINTHEAIKSDVRGTDLNSYSSYSKDNIQHIPSTTSNINKFNNNPLLREDSKRNDTHDTHLSMPKSDLLSPSVNDSHTTGNSHDDLDDFDTSFNDFQSYDDNPKATTITQSNHVPSIRTTPLSPAPILTPTILQPIVANNFKPSIDWSSSDNHSNHSANSVQSNTSSEDPQTEWSDFVSISTVARDFNSSSGMSSNKSYLDINAFKVPIQIGPCQVKKQTQPAKETDVDDWTDFVSSAPAVHNSNNGFKRMEPNDKWNRTTPQFNNWQTNTFQMPHLMPNYSRPVNSNVNGYAYNQQSVLNDFKTSLKFHKSDANNVQYKQAGGSKQRNSAGQNSVHNEISSISSVPELGFAVPQSLLYLSNLPKK